MPDDETKGGRTPDTLDIAALPDDGWPPRHGRPHLRGGRHCRDGQPEVPGPPLNFWDLILLVFVCGFCVRRHSRGDPMGRRLPPVHSRGTFIRGSVLGPHPSPTKREPVGPVSHKNLPLWKELPSVTYWLLPGGIGMPIIVRAVQGTPPVRRADPQHTTLAE